MCDKAVYVSLVSFLTNSTTLSCCCHAGTKLVCYTAQMDPSLRAQLDRFFSGHKHRTYKKRDTLIHEGDVPNCVYYIKSGYIRLYSISKDGEELTRLIMRPGDLFPIRYAVGLQDIDYYAETMTPVEAWQCPREDFRKFLVDHPEVLMLVSANLLTRMGGLYKRMEYLVFGSAFEKVASILLICGERFGKKEGSETIIQVPLTHKDIASLVGVTRETVSIEMEKLEKKKLITCGKDRCITIHNVKALEKESLLTGSD